MTKRAKNIIFAESTSRKRLISVFPLTKIYQLSARRVREKKTDLLLALQQSHHLKCTIPRDRIYSALGYVEPYDIEALPVNYKCSEEEVLIEVAKHLISGTGCLDVLLFCDRDECSLNLPSWVPNWTSIPMNGTPQWGGNTVRLVEDDVLWSAGVQSRHLFMFMSVVRVWEYEECFLES